MAMTASLFRETAKGTRVQHSATSAWLAADDKAHSYAKYVSSRTAPMSISMTAAHAKWGPASLRANETAYNVAFDTDLPFFEHLAEDNTRVDEFADYMQSVRSSDSIALTHLVAALDLSGVPDGGLFVDVSVSPCPFCRRRESHRD